jgi:ATP-dependent DNA helicase RecG
MNLDTPVKEINKIASDLSAKFKKIGIENINDLLFHFPFRYDDYSNLLSIDELVPGLMLTVSGQIQFLESKRSFHRKMLITEAIIEDDTGSIKVSWFNQKYINKILSVGDHVYISGKAILKETGFEFQNPAFEKISRFETAHTARIVPVYSSTEKLSQKQIRFLMKRVLFLAKNIPEWLPGAISKRAGLISLSEAITQIHFPDNNESLEKARFRLKFDEIFILQTRNELTKKELLKFEAPAIKFQEKEIKKFVAGLPFAMNKSQKKCAWDILKDTSCQKPMNRLLEGDVGSGKTITSGLAVLNALLGGYQVGYMAPTEILSEQQFSVFKELFKKYDFKVALLTGSNAKIFDLRTKEEEDLKKTELIKKIKAGELDLIIGTHALIQDKVSFQNLALVIVDEQHRFGVGQRKKIKEKAFAENKELKSRDIYPHFLSMTATPIPRSLALTLYGDLDLSVITEMPQNRKPIETRVVRPDDRKNAYFFIESEIKKGRQAFVICPLVDPSDKMGAKAVKDEFVRLDQEVFKNFKVEILHGRLKSAEKEQIMRDFADNKINILVSTTVIEVGIDVPNTTVIMIESAERFGLAQLHQLRGRVGRSDKQSYCFLFTESDTDSTAQRMQAFVGAKNGFELAEKDLEFRGPGEVYGMRQAGFYDSLKIAKLTDWPVIQAVKPEIENIFAASPDLEKFPQVKNRVREFEREVHFE